MPLETSTKPTSRIDLPCIFLNTTEQGSVVFATNKHCTGNSGPSTPRLSQGLLRFDHLSLVSSSPERLVRLQGRRAETRPIAGTRPRGHDATDDRRLVGELLANEKERAEHVMLVDLERNDLGRVCEFGSVHVDEFMAIEQYSHVSHIVSNISGTIRPDATPFDVIRATFPGGTITGVPKIRCMEIIDELEPVRRGPYTGSFGYIGWNGDLDLNTRHPHTLVAVTWEAAICKWEPALSPIPIRPRNMKKRSTRHRRFSTRCTTLDDVDLSE